MDFPGKRTKQRWIFHDVVGLLKGIIQIIEELGSQKLEPHAIPWFQIWDFPIEFANRGGFPWGWECMVTTAIEATCLLIYIHNRAAHRTGIFHGTVYQNKHDFRGIKYIQVGLLHMATQTESGWVSSSLQRSRASFCTWETLHEPTPWMHEHFNVAIYSMVVMIIVVTCGDRWWWWWWWWWWWRWRWWRWWHVIMIPHDGDGVDGDDILTVSYVYIIRNSCSNPALAQVSDLRPCGHGWPVPRHR